MIETPLQKLVLALVVVLFARIVWKQTSSGRGRGFVKTTLAREAS
jgi:hypothetical protein